MKFTVTQMTPFGFGTFPVLAISARAALDVVASMVERGAKTVEILDANGLRYDLIDLETAQDGESI